MPKCSSGSRALVKRVGQRHVQVDINQSSFKHVICVIEAPEISDCVRLVDVRLDLHCNAQAIVSKL